VWQERHQSDHIQACGALSTYDPGHADSCLLYHTPVRYHAPILAPVIHAAHTPTTRIVWYRTTSRYPITGLSLGFHYTTPPPVFAAVVLLEDVTAGLHLLRQVAAGGRLRGPAADGQHLQGGPTTHMWSDNTTYDTSFAGMTCHTCQQPSIN
jgi:hypothetical protein